jgi:OOP family OmpA-OmpF porin
VQLRGVFQTVIEDLHRDHGRILETFTGDDRELEVLRPQLESCLQKRFRPRKMHSRLLVWITVGVGSVALVLIANSLLNSWRWSRYVEKLKTEPGLVVLDARNGWRRYTLSGLRDPMAADPGNLLKTSGLNPAAVDSRWHTFSSAVPEFVLARSRALLRTPNSVQLAFSDGILKASGTADTAGSKKPGESRCCCPASCNSTTRN